MHVAVAADRALYRFLDDVGDLVDHELGLKEERERLISLSALNDSSCHSVTHLLCRFICHFRGVRVSLLRLWEGE